MLALTAHFLFTQSKIPAHRMVPPTGWHCPLGVATHRMAPPTVWCHPQDSTAYRMALPTWWDFPDHLNVSKDMSKRMFS